VYDNGNKKFLEKPTGFFTGPSTYNEDFVIVACEDKRMDWQTCNANAHGSAYGAMLTDCKKYKVFTQSSKLSADVQH